MLTRHAPRRHAGRAGPARSVKVAATCATILVFGIAMSGLSLAHHGFTGRYDLSQPIWLEGMVVASRPGQPHAEIGLSIEAELTLPNEPVDLAGASDTIRAKALAIRDELRGRVVTIEFQPLSDFFRLGERIGRGQRVAAIAFRNCDAPHQLRAQWVRLAGETPVARSGRASYLVDRC
ncbi:MAG: hypothetical protein K2Z25_17750 [Beijerinckiaceae bacterium]|nr:hypothetical protein [Beijerinckiaceae bacterium]